MSLENGVYGVNKARLSCSDRAVKQNLQLTDFFGAHPQILQLSQQLALVILTD